MLGEKSATPSIGISGVRNRPASEGSGPTCPPARPAVLVAGADGTPPGEPGRAPRPLDGMGGSCEGMTTAGRAVGWGSGPSSWQKCWCHKTALMLPPLCPSQPFKPHLEGSSGRRGCCWAAGRGQPVHDSVQLGRGGWLLAAAGAAAAAAGPAALLRVKQHPMLDRLLQGGRRGGEGRRRSCTDSRHGSMDCASRRQMGGWVVAEDEGAAVRMNSAWSTAMQDTLKKGVLLCKPSTVPFQVSPAAAQPQGQKQRVTPGRQSPWGRL